MLLQSYKEDIKQISTETTIHNALLVIFGGIALKLKKILFQSMSILAIASKGPQETVFMAKYSLQ